MKKLLALTLATTMVASVSASEVKLKLHDFHSPVAGMHKNVIKPWVEAVEKDANGKLDIKIYDSMSLGGKVPQMEDQIISGFVDIGLFLPAYTPGRHPTVSVFEQPFVIDDAVEDSIKLQNLIEVNSDVQHDFKDVHIIGSYLHYPGSLFVNGKSVKSAEDLKGLKVRIPSRGVATLLKENGAVPVSMPMPSIQQALSKNVVDSVVMTFELAPKLKLNELTTTVTTMRDENNKGLYSTVFLLGMNKAKYESLPADIKEAIDKNSGKVFAEFASSSLTAGEFGNYEALKPDLEYNVMPLEDVKKLAKSREGIRKEWVADLTERGYNAEQILKDSGL